MADAGGGPNLGSMTIRIVEAGQTGTAAPSPIQPGGAAPAGTMPGSPAARIRLPASVGRVNNAIGNAASVIGQSTSSPLGAAIGAASLAGPVGLAVAGPLVLFGGALAAGVGALYAFNKAVTTLEGSIMRAARFGGATLVASTQERVSAFSRDRYIAARNDASLAGLQSALTSMRDSLTPLEAGAERLGAILLTGVVSGIDALTQEIGAIASAIGAALVVFPSLATVGADLQQIGADIRTMKQTMKNLRNDPNHLWMMALDSATGNRAFGTAGPMVPPRAAPRRAVP